MIILLLLAELVFAVFEGGWFWVALTVGSLAAVAVSFASGESALRAIQRRIATNKERAVTGWRVILDPDAKAPTLLDRELWEAVVHLHVVYIPPWYGFLLVDGYFMVGLYLVALLALLLRRKPTAGRWATRAISSFGSGSIAEPEGERR